MKKVGAKFSNCNILPYIITDKALYKVKDNIKSTLLVKSSALQSKKLEKVNFTGHRGLQG